MTETCFAPNMAYAPKSPLVFPKDLQHDLRDHMYACRLDTLADWVAHDRLAAHWRADRHPDVLDLVLPALLGDHTHSGRSVEAELFFTLAWAYPVPGVKTPMPLAMMRAR
jgi:hypothetical protein